MLKTNLTKFEVISVRRQKADFLSQGSSKKEKERATRRKGGEEEKAMVALLVFIIEYFGDIIFGDNVINNPVHTSDMIC